MSEPHATRAADCAVPGGDNRLRLPRLDPVSRSRPQGGRGRGPRSARGAGRRRTAARHPPGHRGHRRRPVADPVRARRTAGRGSLWSGANVVLDQRRDTGQPCAVSRARAPGQARGAPAQLARQPDRRLDPQRRLSDVGRARVRRRAGNGSRRHAGGARAGAASHPRGPRRIHRLSDLLRDGRRCGRLRGGCAPRRCRADRRQRMGLAFRLPRPAAGVAAEARRRRDDRLDPQDRRQSDAVGDAAGGARASASTAARWRARFGSCARPARARC